MSKITVIHHSADFDGIFCREIARKFLGDSAEYIGWDFPDKPMQIPNGRIYVMDLPIDKVFGFTYKPEDVNRKGPQQPDGLIWIDHHKTSIETHPSEIQGYRIDGVAACRLAWQWFASGAKRDEVLGNQSKQDFIDRMVKEPYAVRLAGEYDIWDHRDPDAEPFQFALRSVLPEQLLWSRILSDDRQYLEHLLEHGRILHDYQQRTDAGVCKAVSFLVEFEGLKFLAMNTTARNSQAFAAKDVPETGHDALLKFNFTGDKWDCSMYHAKHRTDLDLSAVAKKYGGGGHRGACGFRASSLPFIKNH